MCLHMKIPLQPNITIKLIKRNLVNNTLEKWHMVPLSSTYLPGLQQSNPCALTHRCIQICQYVVSQNCEAAFMQQLGNCKVPEGNDGPDWRLGCWPHPCSGAAHAQAPHVLVIWPV